MMGSPPRELKDDVWRKLFVELAFSLVALAIAGVRPAGALLSRPDAPTRASTRLPGTPRELGGRAFAARANGGLAKWPEMEMRRPPRRYW
jgi:hypothetical protein